MSWRAWDSDRLKLKKWALLRWMTSEFDVTVEMDMGSKHSYHEAFSKLFIWETRILDTAKKKEKAMVASRNHKNKKCYSCKTMVHLVKNYMREKGRYTGKDSGRKMKKCFQCEERGHFAKDCKGKDGGNYAENTTSILTALTELGVSSENGKENYNSWIIHSGCRKIRTSWSENFVLFTSERGTGKFGNDETIQFPGYGKVKVTAKAKGKKTVLMFSHFLSAPDLIYILISMSQARLKNFRIIIEGKNKNPGVVMVGLFHKQSGEIKMVGVETNSGLYRVVVKVRQEKENAETNNADFKWYERLGQCSQKTLQVTVPHVYGIGKINEEEGKMCKSCVLGKITRMPRKRRESRGVTNPAERVYTDVLGPMRHQSIRKHKYILTMHDEYSG